MTKSSWVRGDLTAPTTPEQYHAAMQRQERVIDRLREERDELAAHIGRLINAAPSPAEPDHIAGVNKKVEEESGENHG